MSTKRLPAAMAVTAAVALGAFALAGPAQASTDIPQKHSPEAAPFTGAHSGKSPAVAMAPAVALAKPKGYVVVHSGALSSPANVQAHGSVTCPSGKVPLGGGVFFSSSSVSANINSSYPSGSGWAADVNNGTTAASSFTVYAVCGKAPRKYAVVGGPSTTVNPGVQTAGIAATCPTGSKPLGGGLFSNTFSLAANVNTSIPTTTGWRIDANNGSTAAEQVQAFAVCGKVATYKVVQGTPTTNVAGTQVGATALCTSGVPIGGGAFSSSGSTVVSLNTTYPVTGGWRSYQDNGSTAATTVTPYVVCSG